MKVVTTNDDFDTNDATDGEFPALPYDGSSGGPGVSDKATRYLDSRGITAATQRGVYGYLWDKGWLGGTVKEIRERRPALGHHGRISGALSILHKRGDLALLHQRSEGCRIYVVAHQVADRDVVLPKVPKPIQCPNCGTHV